MSTKEKHRVSKNDQEAIPRNTNDLNSFFLRHEPVKQQTKTKEMILDPREVGTHALGNHVLQCHGAG